MIATDSGTMTGSNASVASFRPSTAPRTDTAGVMIPSPPRRDAPKSPRRTRSIPERVFSAVRGSSSAMSAKVPPSPLLSARITNVRYLKTITSVSAQKKSDRMPRMFASVTVVP